MEQVRIIAMHALAAAKKFFLVLVPAFPILSLRVLASGMEINRSLRSSAEAIDAIAVFHGCGM